MVKVADVMVVNSTVEVPLEREAAFRLFVDRLAEWWPLASHSVFGQDARSVVIEERVGGRIIETGADGRTAEWGVVTAWKDPERIAFTWYPGQEASHATLVEITFDARPEGGTVVDLRHTGWEARGDDAERLVQSYGPGWEFVLGQYRELAEGAD